MIPKNPNRPPNADPDLDYMQPVPLPEPAPSFTPEGMDTLQPPSLDTTLATHQSTNKPAPNFSPRYVPVIREVELYYQANQITQRTIDKIARWWTVGGNSVCKIVSMTNRMRDLEKKPPLIHADIYATLYSLMKNGLLADRVSGRKHAMGLIEFNLLEFHHFYKAWRNGLEKSDCYTMATVAALPANTKLDERGYPTTAITTTICTQTCYKRIYQSLNLRWANSKTKSGKPLSTKEKIHAELLNLAQHAHVPVLEHREMEQPGIKSRAALVIYLDEIPPELYRHAWTIPDFQYLLSRASLEELGQHDLLQKIDADTASLSTGNLSPTELEKKRIREQAQAEFLERVDARQEVNHEVTTVQATSLKTPSALRPELENDLDIDAEDGEPTFDEPSFESLPPDQIQRMQERLSDPVKNSPFPPP